MTINTKLNMDLALSKTQIEHQKREIEKLQQQAQA